MNLRVCDSLCYVKYSAIAMLTIYTIQPRSKVSLNVYRFTCNVAYLRIVMNTITDTLYITRLVC